MEGQGLFDVLDAGEKESGYEQWRYADNKGLYERVSLELGQAN
ncbi:unnamed protein product [marine sediment metagenome]|uniref:Uncharacterized protein n=1 Tax=marine sediment metagenome TaxID=412755 RepID=X1GY47_9ZZZZ